MAVSTRTKESGANAFTVVKMLVPTGEMRIKERFAQIDTIAADSLKSGGGAAMETLATLTAAVPTSLLTRIARQQTQSVDFATSNVRTSPVEYYIAGAKALETYPIGPLAGVAFNATMLSYAGHLDIGINFDAAAVEDAGLYAALLEQSFKDLRRAR